MNQILKFSSILLFATIIAQDLETAIQQFNQQDYRQAVITLEQISNNQPHNANALYYLGLAYQMRMQHQQAVTVFEKGSAIDKNDIRFSLALVESYDHLGWEKKAISLLLELKKLNPENTYIDIKLAGLYFELKDYANAIDTYAQLIKRDTTNALFFKQLGIGYYSLEKWPDAIANLKQAKQLNNNDMAVYIYLYNIYVKQEKTVQALEIVNEGLRLQTDNSQLIRAKAEVLFKTMHYITAEDLYFQLYERGDSSATVLKKLGICYFYSKKWPYALLSLTKSITKDSSDAVVYYYLGLTYAELKNKDKAIKNIEESIAWSLPESLPDVYFELAKLYDENKQVASAIKTYKKILVLYPERTAVLMYLGSLYERSYADKQVALEYYQRYLKAEEGNSTKQTKYVQERISLIKETEFMKSK
jgi:tetratricopeptide (TPR) repeat protein